MKNVMTIKKMTISFLLFSIFNLYVESQTSKNKLNRFTFSISIPIVHNDVFTMPDSIINNTKYLGLTVETGYYLSKKDYIGITLGSIISNGFPFPIAVYPRGISYYWYNSRFIELSNNHVIHSFLENKLHYLLGINYAYHDVTYHPDIPDAQILSFAKSTIGVSVGLKYHAFKHWMVGLKLNSSLYNFTAKSLEYNHIAYIDFIYRFGSKKD